MSPMSPRLLRPRASGAVHPEARDWASRVTANGGSVGSTTLKAVDTFCRSIDATSGLRAAILRCNLFCGSNLSAALVPLYRGASLTGTQLGNTTDTNNNFVSGDYAETGTSGGLKGNATTKTITTGFLMNSLPSLHNSHLSFSATDVEAGAGGVFRTFIGGYGGSAASTFLIQNNSSTNRYFGSGAFSGPNFGFNTTEAHAIGTRTASNVAVGYRSGTAIGTDTNTASNSPTATSIDLFSGTAMRCRMYSIGLGLTAAQALAFSNAVIAFNTALSR